MASGPRRSRPPNVASSAPRQWPRFNSAGILGLIAAPFWVLCVRARRDPAGARRFAECVFRALEDSRGPSSVAEHPRKREVGGSIPSGFSMTSSLVEHRTFDLGEWVRIPRRRPNYGKPAAFPARPAKPAASANGGAARANVDALCAPADTAAARRRSRTPLGRTSSLGSRTSEACGARPSVPA